MFEFTYVAVVVEYYALGIYRLDRKGDCDNVI